MENNLLMGIPHTLMLFVIVIVCTVPTVEEASFSHNVFSQGTLHYPPTVNVNINLNKAIGVNNLSIGCMLDWEWRNWRDTQCQREMARNASFKLMRVFDWKNESPNPVVHWNESSRTGVFNWTDIDLLVCRIFEVGAEPLLCLGGYFNGTPRLPRGMDTNPFTNLPYRESFATYAKEWVRHFKNLGWRVRYYEIINEPFFYFGWNALNMTRLANYVELWNAVTRSMRSENPEILISHDAITQKKVLDYWLENGDDVDFLDVHKYDCGKVGEYSDSEIFARARTRFFETSQSVYGIVEAKRIWQSARGKSVPVIISESNLNSAYENGTDPRIQQMTGAVWLSLVIRASILHDVSYYVYYSFSSTVAFPRPSNGLGFGMTNSLSGKQWYPYYVQWMIGNSLFLGDLIFESTSSSSDLESLVWIEKSGINVLLICKTDEPRRIYLSGVSGTYNSFRVDNVFSYLDPKIQNEAFNVSDPLVTKGYSVILLRTKTLSSS
jgi:hypothetical protein